MLRKAFLTATLAVAMVLMALAPAQASTPVILGFVSGTLPATVTPNKSTQLAINFNTTFSSLSRVCLDLQLDPARGGALTGGEMARLQVVGGGPRTLFGVNAWEKRTTYALVCTSNPADLQVLRQGRASIVVSMRAGTMTVTRGTASAYR